MIVANVLTDIAGLTVLVVAVLGFILAIVFRREIKLVLGRLSTLRAQRGDTAIEATLAHEGEAAGLPSGQAEGPVEEPIGDGETEAISAGSGDPSAPELGPINRDDPESVRRGMVGALIKRDEKSAVELRDRLREIETDPEERVIDLGRWHVLRFIEGTDASGLDQLQRLLDETETPKVRVAIRRFRGIALEHVGSREQAGEEYEAGIVDTRTPETLAEFVVKAAENWKASGDPSRGVGLVERELADVSDEAAELILWRGLAEITDDQQLARIALNKAASLMPADASSRFDAGYAVGFARGESLLPLALHHYRATTDLEPDHAAAWNNVGVEMGNASLPMNRVRNYRRAADLGNTLAMANLAYIYIGEGLFDEAEDLLDRARQAPNPHANVASAMAELATRRDKEASEYKELLARGQRQAEFLRRFADARAKGDERALAGTWLYDGTERTTSIDNGELAAAWGQKRDQRKITGYTHGSSARVTIWEMGFSYDGTEKGWQRKHDGFAFVDSRGDFELMLAMDDVAAWENWRPVGTEVDDD